MGFTSESLSPKYIVFPSVYELGVYISISSQVYKSFEPFMAIL